MKTLKRKLEYHEVSAKAAAKEAHELANVMARSSLDILADRTDADLKKGRLANPVMEKWSSSPTRYRNSPTEIEIPDDLSNYI